MQNNNNKRRPTALLASLCLAAGLHGFAAQAAEPTVQLPNKAVLTQEAVQKVLDAATQHAKQNNWPVSIVVVDDGGHMLGMTRLDGAFALTVDIATGKARTSALTRWESGFPEQLINQGRYSFLSVPGVFLEGGVPIQHSGQTIGAVAASGVTSAQDAEIARAGVAALGLPKP